MLDVNRVINRSLINFAMTPPQGLHKPIPRPQSQPLNNIVRPKLLIKAWSANHTPEPHPKSTSFVTPFHPNSFHLDETLKFTLGYDPNKRSQGCFSEPLDPEYYKLDTTGKLTIRDEISISSTDRSCSSPDLEDPTIFVQNELNIHPLDGKLTHFIEGNASCGKGLFEFKNKNIKGSFILQFDKGKIKDGSYIVSYPHGGSHIQCNISIKNGKLATTQTMYQFKQCSTIRPQNFPLTHIPSFFSEESKLKTALSSKSTLTSQISNWFKTSSLFKFLKTMKSLLNFK